MKKETVKVYCKDCRNYHPIKFIFKRSGVIQPCYMKSNKKGDFKSPDTRETMCYNPAFENRDNRCYRFLENPKKGHMKYLGMFYDLGEKRWKRVIEEEPEDKLKEQIEEAKKLIERMKELLDQCVIVVEPRSK